MSIFFLVKGSELYFLSQIMSIEDVERIMDETREGIEYQRVSDINWKALISAVFNQMLKKNFDFLSAGDWRTFKWKFDSGRWRCCVTRIRGDDKGLYFVPSADLIFTLGSLIVSSRVGMGMHWWYKGYKANLLPRISLLTFLYSK